MKTDQPIEDEEQAEYLRQWVKRQEGRRFNENIVFWCAIGMALILAWVVIF